jgi:cation diffusion facilitator family transporter
MKTEADTKEQRRVLWAVLAINAAFFAIEITAGLLSGSMGLMADSLDMLADALVYGMSLAAVGAAAGRKKNVAVAAGVAQLVLAAAGLAEVVRRVAGAEPPPDFPTMMGVSLLALGANALCLWLLHRMKSNEAHIRASVIFSANDVIINAGVIVAGALVWLTRSAIPDLVVGIAVFLIVIRGAVKILKLSR